jgi:mannosylglycoprotein endo-beta-mannosidase
LDIAKAFDSISWQFILEVLGHKGFGHRWISWIAMLLRTASKKILINGLPGDSIVHRRGVRQGDPISPLLFILAMDSLSSLVDRAQNVGLLQPLGIPHRVSFYADDVVAFIQPTLQEIRTATEILKIFSEASGLRANFAKCAALPIQCSEEDLLLAQAELPCPLASFPCKYLGLPLSIFRLKKEDLQPLIDKVANRLPTWKAEQMAPIGHITMVKSVLSSMPIYLLIAIDPPKWVIKGIDKFRRGFLWAGQEGQCSRRPLPGCLVESLLPNSVWRPGRSELGTHGDCSSISVDMVASHFPREALARPFHPLFSERTVFRGCIHDLLDW